MSDWQPIKTAPRDGTRLLLCYDEMIMSIGRWIPDMHGSNAPGYWTSYRASHWMPLPSPPETDNG